MKVKIFAWIGLAALIFASSQVAAHGIVINQVISEAVVLAAQQEWCDALVAISALHDKNGQSVAKALAEQVIDTACGYQLGAVLFKPTLTLKPQTFRTTRAGALSYFVGGDLDFPSDTGFALKGWKTCEIDNAAMFIAGDSASTMGKVHFTGKDGNVTSVDKTLGLCKG